MAESLRIPAGAAGFSMSVAEMGELFDDVLACFAFTLSPDHGDLGLKAPVAERSAKEGLLSTVSTVCEPDLEYKRVEDTFRAEERLSYFRASFLALSPPPRVLLSNEGIAALKELMVTFGLDVCSKARLVIDGELLCRARCFDFTVPCLLLFLYFLPK
jgi:hypothetical protein